jgi:hypothetical protein
VNALVTAAPEAAVSAARSGVAQLRAAGGGVLGRKVEPGAKIFLSAPHRVYHLGLKDPVHGHIPEHARPGAWRFMLVDGDDALAAVEVRERDGNYVFSDLNAGPFVASTVEAVRRLERFGEAPHEMRLLRVPALYLEALWLHGDFDRFMPLAPTIRGIEAFRMYSEPEFSRLISDLAATHSQGPALAP